MGVSLGLPALIRRSEFSASLLGLRFEEDFHSPTEKALDATIDTRQRLTG